MLRLLLLLTAIAANAAPTEWGFARSPKFEVYAQGGQASARSLLLRFEQLRQYFLEHTGLAAEGGSPLRVIAFRSAEEYAPYRLRPASDAYYAGAGERHFIVMSSAANLGMAAHEFWHFAARAGGLQLPPWLNEGLADFYAGADHHVTLRSKAWIPLDDLLALPAESPLRDDRNASGLYYAESSALAGMLMEAPDYAPRMPELLRALAAGTPAGRALAAVYGKSLDTIARDLRVWADKRRPTPLVLPSAEDVPMESADISSVDARSVLAEVLLDTGRLERAEAVYRGLAQDAPGNANFPAALALIALRKGEYDDARRQWARASEQGLHDAEACYRYAIQSQDAGFPPEEVRSPLEKAIALRPDFDDALYVLALLEMNANEYDAALRHLRTMRSVSAGRQYVYWATMAYAFTELGRREEAQAAARQAASHAATAAERAHAAELGVIAATDMVVQFTRDADGNLRLATTRTRHDAPEWNPFIEPGDQVRRAEGRLREIRCEGDTTFAVETATGTVRLAVPDPRHVQMRNAPSEFTCGPQPGPDVVAVYAASGQNGGVLRGLEFR